MDISQFACNQAEIKDAREGGFLDNFKFLQCEMQPPIDACHDATMTLRVAWECDDTRRQ